MEVLPWVAYSPDINPIENIWGIIVKKIYYRNFRPQNLWEIIHACWEELDSNIVSNIIQSMPNRLAQVIEKQTRY